jgi:hypothetical protein
MDLTGVHMMMSKFLVAATAATFMLVGGAALAQQGKNAQHIQDGNNIAPRYSAMAPAKNQSVRHIQDGNNTALRYPAVTRASATAPTGTHATAKRRATHG